MRKGPKLRPSLSWEEMAVTIKAIDIVVTSAVKDKQVTKDIMEMAKVKDYLETYKPNIGVGTLSEQQLLAQLMKKYQMPPEVMQSVSLPETTESEPVAELTDDERYDILKLSGESAYTEDDKLFMLNKGTMIMIQRASGKSVNTSDL